MILREEYDLIKLMAHVKGLFDQDNPKPLEVTIKPYDPKKTNAQCNLYWDWVDDIRKVTGNHKVHQDENLRELFLTPKVYTNAKGETKEYYKRISEMGKKEMSAFMDEVFVMATQHGFKLKDPIELQRNE